MLCLDFKIKNHMAVGNGKSHSAFAATRVLSTAELYLMKNWSRLEEAEREIRKKWWCGKLLTLVSS